MHASREKRNFVRWKVQKPLRYRIPALQDGEERLALLRDVSFSGAQVSSLENLRLNEHLDMVMEIPDEQNTISCEGKVVWQNSIEEEGKRHFVCGLLFTRIAEDAKENIFKHVWSLAPKEEKKRWWSGA